ncbi:MAG: hypothetical protein LQ346_002222 [Caloplaca aetnensis]|nr:MAG: hypothetical protein LQ346_002222 [Caloplaca aetnensis]
MVTPDVAKGLRELGDSLASQDRPAGYKKLLDQIVSSAASPRELTSNLEVFIESVLADNLGIVAARPLLAAAVESIRSVAELDLRIQAGTTALRLVGPRVTSFEEQDAQLRGILADAYTLQEEYVEAAKVLQGIQLESSQRRIPDDHKVSVWIRICRLYLEEDDTTSAESYLNRAKNLRHQVSNPELILGFQLSEARILDARRKFLEASQAYHSFSFSNVLDEEERTRALSSAIVCAVLAGAGPQRSRALGKLYKDDRAPQVPEFGILENMFLDRLLSPEEVTKFSEKLSSHQLAQTSDGSTVLAKAVVEHNLLSVSRLYDNIGLDELANLLGLDADKAEGYAARMLEQGRIAGSIDQIDRVILFGDIVGSTERGGSEQRRTVGAKRLRKWDARVQGVAEELERIASMIQLHNPVSKFRRLGGPRPLTSSRILHRPKWLIEGTS